MNISVLKLKKKTNSFKSVLSFCKAFCSSTNQSFPNQKSRECWNCNFRNCNNFFCPMQFSKLRKHQKDMYDTNFSLFARSQITPLHAKQLHITDYLNYHQAITVQELMLFLIQMLEKMRISLQFFISHFPLKII